MHKGVGAIIRDSNNKILLLDRVYPPPGWAGPAGHVEEGETPEEAVIREVKEETNLDIKNLKLLFHEYLDWNYCWKHQGHDLTLYEAGEWSGEIKRCKDESKDMKWFSPEEIKKLKLEEVWEYWFKKLKII